MCLLCNMCAKINVLNSSGLACVVTCEHTKKKCCLAVPL